MSLAEFWFDLAMAIALSPIACVLLLLEFLRPARRQYRAHA